MDWIQTFTNTRRDLDSGGSLTERMWQFEAPHHAWNVLKMFAFKKTGREHLRAVLTTWNSCYVHKIYSHCFSSRRKSTSICCLTPRSHFLPFIRCSYILFYLLSEASEPGHLTLQRLQISPLQENLCGRSGRHMKTCLNGKADSMMFLCPQGVFVCNELLTSTSLTKVNSKWHRGNNAVPPQRTQGPKD